MTDLNKRIFLFIQKSHRDGDDHFVSLNDEFNQDEIGRISKMKIRRMELSSNDDNVLMESIFSLRRSVEKKTSEETNTIDKLNEILSKMRVE